MKQARRNKARDTKLSKWMFPALLALVAAAFLLVLSFVRGETQTVLDAPVYQYFLTQRVDYEAGTKLIPGQYSVTFRSGGEDSAGDATPIYYRDSQELILPQSMTWLDASTGVEWAIPAMSRLEMNEHQAVSLKSGKKTPVLSGGFLSDGLGTYLFLDEVTLEFNGERMTLPPFSFCSTADGMVRIYAYGQQELYHAAEQTTNLLIHAPGRYYEADLTRAIYTGADGQSRLLSASPKALPEYQG